MIPSVDEEARLAKRLEQHGLFLGITTTELRRERLREAILKVGPCVIVGANPKTGRPETYEQCFERIYGVPFEAMT